jgi:hypothetical protein
MNACLDYISNPCEMTSAFRFADVIYDAVHPTCSISKISERFGPPENSTPVRRRLMEATGSQQLFILMLFNYSKPGGNMFFAIQCRVPPGLLFLFEHCNICSKNGQRSEALPRQHI